uniref:Beta-Ig-H3/fasciclin n=1 Tax=uncultured haloarchaeon TaxID=160804 RepID=A5YT27_9EURY|nr:Beta-Ig-H3/fasciclin [uncultured haloarchaeon]
MTSKQGHGATRRTTIKAIAGGLAVSAAGGVGSVSAASHVDATIRMNNVGSTAYEVSSVSGTNVSAETGINNPEITLTATGTRYRIENNGYPNHPLEFQDESGTILLSQDDSGSFENDDAVNWMDNGDSVEFTLTSDLSTQIATYRCTVHSGAMVGDITADIPMVDYTPQTGSVSFTTPDDGATVTSPVSFEMTAENFTVEQPQMG